MGSFVAAYLERLLSNLLCLQLCTQRTAAVSPAAIVLCIGTCMSRYGHNTRYAVGYSGLMPSFLVEVQGTHAV
jgi:hypothetical protein